MIVRSSKGGSVAKALAYVEGPGRDQATDRATLLGGGGFGFDPDGGTVDIAKRLMVQNGSREFQGEKDKYCEQDCLHLSLAWDPAQAAPDEAEKRETARQALKGLGMGNAMHLVYDHNDKGHHHIHIVASRIDPETGKAYDDYKRVERSLSWALEKEREDAASGLRPVPEAKRSLHAAQLVSALGLEVSPEQRLESIRKLYGVHDQELEERATGKRAVKKLYRAHRREASERQLDRYFGSIAKGIGVNRDEEKGRTPDLQMRVWRERARNGGLRTPMDMVREMHSDGQNQLSERKADMGEQKKMVKNDNERWISSLIDVWERNRKAGIDAAGHDPDERAVAECALEAKEKKRQREMEL